jgi:hypothetical protein
MMDIGSVRARWEAAAHRIQTATALRFSLEYPWMDERLQKALKHIRVGVDTTKADQGALAGLLIAKGIITQQEYFDAGLKGQIEEADRQEQWLQEQMGGDNPNLRIRTY